MCFLYPPDCRAITPQTGYRVVWQLITYFASRAKWQGQKTESRRKMPAYRQNNTSHISKREAEITEDHEAWDTRALKKLTHCLQATLYIFFSSNLNPLKFLKTILKDIQRLVILRHDFTTLTLWNSISENKGLFIVSIVSKASSKIIDFTSYTGTKSLCSMTLNYALLLWNLRKWRRGLLTGKTRAQRADQYGLSVWWFSPDRHRPNMQTL